MPRMPRKAWPFSITRAGIIFLAMMGFVMIATVNSGVNLLYLLFGVMVGVLLVSMLVASWTLRRIVITRDFGGHVIAGSRSDIEYQVSSTKRIWPTMALHFREIHDELTEEPHGFVLYLPAGDATPVRVATHLTARRRGVVKLRAIELSTAFPFGFIRRWRRIEVPQEMVVYPRLGILNRHLAMEYRESVESGAMTSNRRGGNDEFYGVREYRAGDNIRTIHWRSTARRGEFMIREMATNAPPQMIVVLNPRNWRKEGVEHGGADGREQLERAIELAAALVCYGFFENFAVGLAIAGVETEAMISPRMGREARSLMLQKLALLDPDKIDEARGIEFPNRVAGRAEWVVVTLHGDDLIRDLVPSSGKAAVTSTGGMGGGGGGRGGHRTVLAMDARDSADWLHFLSPEETHRLLRDRE